MTASSNNTPNKVWHMTSYSSAKDLKYSDTEPIPSIRNKTDVLVKVHAFSVNPIDYYMASKFLLNYLPDIFHINYYEHFTAGFGSKLINLARKEAEFPLILGRDFSGEIIQKGTSVKDLEIGQIVWGVVPVQRTGCAAQYVVVDAANVII